VRVSSYDPDRLGGTFEDEVARLRAQVAMSWPVEQRRLAALGIRDGLHVLEAGCGPGFFTERLAAWLPRSPIVALDADLRMLQIASQHLRRDEFDRRIELRHAHADDTGLPSAAFDVAISRYLFQHLRDPVAAATEIRRVLRPRGVHVVIDVDDGLWGLAEPAFPEFANWHRRRAAAQGARGGDRFRGRRLARILREAGYARVQLDVFAYDSDDAGLAFFAAQLDPDQFVPLLDDGLLSLTEYARARSLYERFLASPDAFVLAVGFIAYAENHA
jgi:SAM-dependent methyltransferase